MKVVRYFHIRHLNAPKGGATVRVEGDNDGTLEDKVLVSVSMCSQNDAFCRRTGRKWADDVFNRKVQEIPLKGLPGKLHRVAASVLKRTKGVGVPRENTDLFLRDYAFSTKYFRRPDGLLQRKPRLNANGNEALETEYNPDQDR